MNQQINTTPTNKKPIIAANGIRPKWYSGENGGGYTFNINEGEIVCILGKSGAGKSVILNILSGFNKKFDGTLEIGGARRLNWTRNVKELKRIVSFVPQTDIHEYNKTAVYVALLLTMLASSMIGLLMSTISKKNPQRATLSIPFIMIFQILFSGSGLIFDLAELAFLDYFSISSYSIFALGDALRFDLYGFDAGPYFEYSLNAMISNLVPLIGFSLLFLIACIFLLKKTDSE